MSVRNILLAGGFALFPSIAPPVAAQAPLRLGDLYQLLTTASPRIAAASALADAAEARVSATRRPPDPQVQLGFMNRSLPGLGYDEPLGMDQLQLMQMLPFPGKLAAAGRAAAERADAERSRAAEVAWEVRARGAMEFYDLYRMEGQLGVARETYRLLQDLTKTAEAMYRVGEGRQADLLRAQVELARMEEEILRMEAERDGARARLNALLARAPDVGVGDPVLPAFPELLPPLDTLVAEATSHRPMVRAGAAEVRASEAEQRLARRELWPDLQLGLQYGRRPMSDGSTDRMVSLMLGISVPIFAGSRQLAMRREATAMRAMADADLADMRATTRGRLGELYLAVGRATRLGTLYRTTILPQAEAAAGSAQASYRVGTVDFMTLLDDRMTVNRYRQELVALDAERGTALAELEMLLGRALFDATSVEER